jgi:DNA-3-methyladenine glycosylase
MRVLPADFYRRPDTVALARELLGKVLETACPRTGAVTRVRITETEAYVGREDPACHAHAGRRTARTEMMYAAGGVAYVYRCYGIHDLLNVVTHAAGEPHAVLIRAGEPLLGLDVLHERRGIPPSAEGRLPPARLCTGPGSLARALGLTLSDNGADLGGPRITLLDDGTPPPAAPASGPRVGIAGAGPEAAARPWRFWVPGSRWVSRYVP